MITLHETQKDQRYESADKKFILMRCRMDWQIWRLWVNNVCVDYGYSRNEVIEGYGVELKES